jgi:hypothetical protein
LKTSGAISYDLDFAGAPLPVLPRLILATAAVPESSSLAQLIRGIHGACSCNGVPSLAPSCSSRCSTFCRRSPCSHRRDGRNRADRFVCQAYDGLQEFIQRTACRSCRFTDNALGCRRLAHKNSTPSVHRATFESFEGVGTFDRIGDCVDRAISGPLNAITAVVSGMASRIHCHPRVRSGRADATPPTVGSGLRNDVLFTAP